MNKTVSVSRIDPGSVKTGFGIIKVPGAQYEYIASGVIRLPRVALPERLQVIFSNLCEIIEQYGPQTMAIEQVFMSKNAGSALKLGQARGAALVAATSHDLPVAEYEARKVKQSVVGHGGADKKQVQLMVKHLLKLSATPQEDAADALAIALCHAHTSRHLAKVSKVKTFRRGRMI